MLCHCAAAAPSPAPLARSTAAAIPAAAQKLSPARWPRTSSLSCEVDVGRHQPGRVGGALALEPLDGALDRRQHASGERRIAGAAVVVAEGEERLAEAVVLLRARDEQAVRLLPGEEVLEVLGGETVQPDQVVHVRDDRAVAQVEGVVAQLVHRLHPQAARKLVAREGVLHDARVEGVHDLALGQADAHRAAEQGAPVALGDGAVLLEAGRRERAQRGIGRRERLDRHAEDEALALAGPQCDVVDRAAELRLGVDRRRVGRQRLVDADAGARAGVEEEHLAVPRQHGAAREGRQPVHRGRIEAHSGLVVEAVALGRARAGKAVDPHAAAAAARAELAAVVAHPGGDTSVVEARQQVPHVDPREHGGPSADRRLEGVELVQHSAHDLEQVHDRIAAALQGVASRLEGLQAADVERHLGPARVEVALGRDQRSRLLAGEAQLVGRRQQIGDRQLGLGQRLWCLRRRLGLRLGAGGRRDGRREGSHQRDADHPG